MEFDFDAWAKLARDDPAAFERRREATLNAAIEAAPPAFRPRLRGLQCRLDLERRRASTALASCVRMNTLMWAGFYRLRKELLSEPAQAPRSGAQPPRSAQVIPFGARRRTGEGKR